jgi:serine/threonine-protein kinase RIO1
MNNTPQPKPTKIQMLSDDIKNLKEGFDKQQYSYNVFRKYHQRLTERNKNNQKGNTDEILTTDKRYF